MNCEVEIPMQYTFEPLYFVLCGCGSIVCGNWPGGIYFEDGR